MGYSKTQVGQKDFYNYYKEVSEKKNREYVDYKLYSKIIKDANLLIRDKLVYSSERFYLPYRLGQIYIHKYENIYNPDNIVNWKVDWKATKEAGHKIYFESKYGYKWKWDKKGACVKGRRFYIFKPCRKASRLVPDAIKNKNIDYYQ